MCLYCAKMGGNHSYYFRLIDSMFYQKKQLSPEERRRRRSKNMSQTEQKNELNLHNFQIVENPDKSINIRPVANNDDSMREQLNGKDKGSLKSLIMNHLMSLTRLSMTVNAFNKYRFKRLFNCFCCRN